MSDTPSSNNNKDALPSDAAEDVYDLAISAREETETCRKIAPIVVKKLSALSLFRMGLPKSLGGWQGNPVETLKAYETLASAEASVSWIVWNNHLACTFGRFLDDFWTSLVCRKYTVTPLMSMPTQLALKVLLNKQQKAIRSQVNGH
ncbi:MULTISPECIES: acyl-CoA dehydrogenase family protein [Psychrobacter]|uniref:acyl-CoA dehydrogenase family protein n=1 Tax=Psychrobacter TaxID=497 RepID=UPI00191AECE7|nr:acyl-CoA dehydrogenase family protein [Psychrobacter immobilis]